MLIDDDKPDYFTEEGTPRQDDAAGSGRPTISFADDSDAGYGTLATAQRKHSRWKQVFAWGVAVCVAVLCVAFWLRYFNPYATDCRMVGYVTSVEKRGILFKTYEADIISERALTDTTRIYSHDMSLSVDKPALIHRLQSAQGSGRPVTVVYRKYYGTLPWRGASKYVIDQVSD